MFSEPDARYEHKSSTQLYIFDLFLKIDVYKPKYFWYMKERYYRAHTDQLNSLTNLKINFRTNRGTSEGPETSEQEYLTRRIQIYRVYFYLGIIWKVMLKKRSKMDHTKIDTAYLHSPCQEFSNGGLSIVVAPPVCSGDDFPSACTGGPIQLYRKEFKIEDRIRT